MDPGDTSPTAKRMRLEPSAVGSEARSNDVKEKENRSVETISLKDDSMEDGKEETSSFACTVCAKALRSLRSLFEPFGTVEQVILYKPQFAYVVFKWGSDASDAKHILDLQKRTGVGEYIDVLLRDVQFARHAGDTRMQMSSRPYDKLRIAFRDPALPLPSSKTSSGQPNMPVEDDFFNDYAFSSPEVLAILHR